MAEVNDKGRFAINLQTQLLEYIRKTDVAACSGYAPARTNEAADGKLISEECNIRHEFISLQRRAQTTAPLLMMLLQFWMQKIL